MSITICMIHNIFIRSYSTWIYLKYIYNKYYFQFKKIEEKEAILPKTCKLAKGVVNPTLHIMYNIKMILKHIVYNLVNFHTVQKYLLNQK